MFSRFLCAAVALILTAWAVPAAAYRLPLLTRQVRFVGCPEPTLAQCQSAVYRRSYCGKVQMARAAVDETAPCNVHYQNAAEGLRIGMPIERVTLPPTVVGADGTASAPQSLILGECAPLRPHHTCAHVQLPSYQGFYARGGATLAFAQTLQQGAYGPASNTTSEASTARLVRALQRLHWLTTPAGRPHAVRTCNEYQYEKYYDYQVFEESAALQGFDPRAVYDVAYGAVGDRSSIGTRGIAGLPLAQLDGTPFAAQIAFPEDQLKNVFFGLDLADDVLAPPGEESIHFLVPCEGRSHVFVDKIWLEDRSLYALASQQPLHDESFLWHQQQNDYLRQDAGYLDEDLYALDALKEELSRALAERAFLEDAYRSMLTYMATLGRDNVVVNEGIDNDPFPDPTNPWEQLAYVVAAHEGGVDVMNAGEQVGGVIFGPANTFAANVDPDPDQTAAYLQSTFALELCAADPTDDFFTQISIRLSNVDKDIERILGQARDAGCLDPVNPSPCDWSPALFAQRVTDLFVAEREADFTQCLQRTGGSIEQRRARTFHIGSDFVTPVLNDHGVNCSTRMAPGNVPLFWDDNPRAVDEYFLCIDAWIRANIEELVAHQGSPFDGYGNVVVGKGTSDKLELGNNDFGATLEYEARFGVNGFQNIGVPGNPNAFLPEKLDHTISGKAIAGGRIFGKTKALFDGRMKATLSEVDVDLIVNGEQLYAGPPEQTWVGSVAPVMDGRELRRTFVEAQTVVPVFGVPVTVRGGISGAVGMSYAVTAIQNPAPSVTLNDQLVASFQPYSTVDGFASASVNAAIFEVGVKGSLTIVRLSLPYGAATHVYRPVGPDGQPVDPAIDVKGQADLALHMLGGNLRAFGEMDFGFYSRSVQVPLYSWGGIHYGKTLWADEYSVSVEPLFIVQRDGFPGL